MSEQNTAKTLPDRNEIEESSTWRLEDIFKQMQNGNKNSKLLKSYYRS